MCLVSSVSSQSRLGPVMDARDNNLNDIEARDNNLNDMNARDNNLNNARENKLNDIDVPGMSERLAEVWMDDFKKYLYYQRFKLNQKDKRMKVKRDAALSSGLSNTNKFLEIFKAPAPRTFEWGYRRYTDHPSRRREAAEHGERADDIGIFWITNSESAARNIQEQGDQETASDVALGGAVSYFNFQHDITT